jgi:ribosomal protein S18 acetylase RimI-like enzyme
MNPEAFRNVPKTEFMAVTPQGQKFKTTLSRERTGIQSIRLDGISDVQLYQPNGQPVQVKVNKPELINKVRANWSPATTQREKLPNGETVTDTATGERMIILPKGKVKLFGADGQLAGVFEDEDAAVLKSNQDKLKSAMSSIQGNYIKVPTQKELDVMKANLPEHSAKIQSSKGEFGTTYKIDLFDQNSNKAGYAYAYTDVDNLNLLHIEATYIDDPYRSQGYGQALYREIAKIAQDIGVKKLTSSETSKSAAIARSKILKTNWSGEWGSSAESVVPSDIRFSPRAADSAYAKATKENNTKAAQQIVNEAAKFAGYTIGPVFHGTSKEFNVFKPNAAQGWGEGVYFASDKPVAKEFGGRVVSAFLKIDKPFTGSFSQADEAKIPQTKTYQNALKKYEKVSRFVDPETKELDWFELQAEDGQFANSLIRDLGYDGIISKDSANVQTGDEIVVFNPSQVKSAAPIVYDDQNQIIPPSRRFNVASADIRFSPRRKGETLQEQRAREYQEELIRVGLGREGGNVIGDDATHVEEIVTARNQLVREETPTFAGKLGDPELERRLDVSTAVQEAAAAREAVSKKVSKAQRIRKQLQARQADIQRAVAAKAASGELGPVEVGSPQHKKMFELKTLEDLPGGTSGRVPPTQPSFTLEQFRRAIGNAYVEEFPTPAEVPPAVTDLISQKTPRTEIERRNELARIAETERRAGITHRTVLGSIQSDAANAARVGDMKIEQMLKAMSEKREAMFDAELARVRNKFNTMELQGKAEEARQAGIDPEIVRLRNEHFANVQRQIAQAAEPAPLNSGTPEPPAQTQLPGIATAADDARIPRDIAIQYSRGKFRIWSIGRQAVQAVTETYQEALKKAQAIQLKRRGKQNAA